LPKTFAAEIASLPLFTVIQIYVLTQLERKKFFKFFARSKRLQEFGIHYILKNNLNSVLVVIDNKRSYFHILTETVAWLIRISRETSLQIIIEADLLTRLPVLESIMSFYELNYTISSDNFIEYHKLPTNLITDLLCDINYPKERNISDLVSTVQTNSTLKTDCIYIRRNSKNKLNGRYLENEEKLIYDLALIGVRAVELDELSFNDQVSLFNSAKLVIGISGAGLTNVIFMEKLNNVIELVPKDEVKWHFMTLAIYRSLNYKHFYLNSMSFQNNRPKQLEFDEINYGEFINYCNMIVKA
jgi:capsular polysaccharide biosynthesis protein